MWRVAAVLLPAALALATLTTSVPVVAEEPPPIDVDAAPASTWFGEHYYGVFRGETRVGWLRRSLERVEWEERPAVCRSLETYVSIAGDGNTRRTTERAFFALDAPQHLLEIERRVESQGRSGGRKVVRRGGRFDIVTTRDGEETTGAVAALEILLADELVTETLVALASEREEGPVGAAASAVGLDLMRMRPVKRVLAVRGTETTEDGETLYRIAVATGPDEWSEPVVVDARGAIVRGELGGGLEMRRMPREEAQAELGSGSIEVADRIPMPARLGDPLTIRELEISMPAPAEGQPIPFPESPRQTVQEFEGRLHLRVRPALDAGPVEDDERAAALRPEGGIDSDHPAVVAAANRLLAGTSRAPVRVRRLLDFCARQLEDAVVVEEPRASELLTARYGDCTEHTRLFVALARAAGIPAREVTGLIWIDDEQQSFGWHAWAEVALEGRWRPVDPSRGLSPAHAAHIRVDPAARDAGVLTDVRFEFHEARR